MQRLVRRLPSSGPRLVRGLVIMGAVLCGDALAGDPAAGMALFNNIPDAVLSCGNASCHGPNPNDNVNGLQRGANNPGVIQSAIRSVVPQMMFLTGLLNPLQFDDLAAYLAPQPSLSDGGLDFPDVVVGTPGSPKFSTLSSIGGANLVVTAVTVAGPDTADFILGGTCAAGAILPSATIVQTGGACTITAVFSPIAPGRRSASVTLAYGGAATFPSEQTIQLTGNGIVGATPACPLPTPPTQFQAVACPAGQEGLLTQVRDSACQGMQWTYGPWITFENTCRIVAVSGPELVEYYNSVLDHYFITADPAEGQSVETGGAGPGWIRKGVLGRLPAASADVTPAHACRFYGNRAAGPDGRPLGPNSHFYTIDVNECQAVKTDRGWIYEGIVFDAVAPQNGQCPAPLIPVYRNYNGRFAANDSNHRYSVDPAVVRQMVLLGWASEGVVVCLAPI